jgi:hypothetical protein
MNLLKKAKQAARKIPSGKNTAKKRKAVHAWALAVKEMLNGR